VGTTTSEGKERVKVELHQLRCLLAVIEEGGFNRATTRLHITQPALSYQIKQLEGELGIRLFDRRPGGVSPTEAGRLLARHARQVLEAVRQARQSVEELAQGVNGEVRIGTVNSVGIYFLPQLLWSLRKQYPRLRPHVLYRHSNEIIEALLANQVDLALVANPSSDRRLHTEVIIEEQVWLVCGRGHSFFGRKNIRPSELKGAQFVALSQESPTGRLVRDHLARMGISVEPVVSTDNVETVKKMVEIGLGVAFLPEMVTSGEVHCDDGTGGRLARLQVGPPITRRIVLAYWKNSELSRATATFVEQLREYAEGWKGCIEPDQ